MGEGLSHWSSMVLRKSQTYFFDRHTHPNSMYSNFCHVLKDLCLIRLEKCKTIRLVLVFNLNINVSILIGLYPV